MVKDAYAEAVDITSRLELTAHYEKEAGKALKEHLAVMMTDQDEFQKVSQVLYDMLVLVSDHMNKHQASNTVSLLAVAEHLDDYLVSATVSAVDAGLVEDPKAFATAMLSVIAKITMKSVFAGLDERYGAKQ